MLLHSFNTMHSYSIKFHSTHSTADTGYRLPGADTGFPNLCTSKKFSFLFFIFGLISRYHSHGQFLSTSWCLIPPTQPVHEHAHGRTSPDAYMSMLMTYLPSVPLSTESSASNHKFDTSIQARLILIAELIWYAARSHFQQAAGVNIPRRKILSHRVQKNIFFCFFKAEVWSFSFMNQ